jgi:uncharacterized phiE125 gp8 family phage protein
MALNANALVTLNQGKTELDIPLANTSEDSRIEDFINAASDFIEAVTGRKFKADDYTEYFDGNDLAYLLLSEFPINTVTSVHIDDQWVFAAASELVSTERRIMRDVLIARRCGIFHYKSTQSIKVVYNAGYATIPNHLQQACLELVKYLYVTRNDRRIGKTSSTKINESASFAEGIPAHILPMIEPERWENYIARKLHGMPLAETLKGKEKA